MPVRYSYSNLTYALVTILLVVLFLCMFRSISRTDYRKYRQSVTDKTISNRLEKLVNDLGIENEQSKPVIAVAVFNSRTIRYGFYGRVQNGNLVDEDTLFFAPNMAKPVTSVALLNLLYEIDVPIKRRVEKFYKEYKPEGYDELFGKRMTFSGLLSNTSGLNKGTSKGFKYPPFPSSNNFPKENKLLATLNGICKIKFSNKCTFYSIPPVKLINKPFTKVQESSHGYALLGYIIENLTNTAYEDYIKKEIFDQLKMIRTTSNIPWYNENWEYQTKKEFSAELMNELRTGNVALGNEGDRLDDLYLTKGWRRYPNTAVHMTTTLKDYVNFLLTCQQGVSRITETPVKNNPLLPTFEPYKTRGEQLISKAAAFNMVSNPEIPVKGDSETGHFGSRTVVDGVLTAFSQKGSVPGYSCSFYMSPGSQKIENPDNYNTRLGPGDFGYLVMTNIGTYHEKINNDLLSSIHDTVIPFLNK